MAILEEEKRLFKRKILFLLVIGMNEIMIHYFKDRSVFGYTVNIIGNSIRIIIGVLIVLSILHYIKEKAIKVEIN
ncbi:MAG: hypothetical protein ABIC04_00845 [Nanoarchaeota archaeon]